MNALLSTFAARPPSPPRAGRVARKAGSIARVGLFFFLLTATAWSADGLQATRAAVAPNLDGKLDDKAWKTAAVLSGFSGVSGGKAAFDTTGLLMWDPENLYIAMFCRDEKPDAVGKGDSIEIQLAKSATGRPCYSLKVSPSGPPVLRLMADDKNPSPWTASGVRYAPGTDAKAWILEVAIPFASLNMQAPAPGDQWFLRVNRVKVSGHAEQTYWAADASGVNQEKGFGPIVLATAP